MHVEKVPQTDPVTGKKTTRRITVFPRFHQWHAVRRLLDSARVEGTGAPKLVQHSAGSGKSNTLAWLAHGLSRLHTPHDVTLLTDSARAAGLGADVPVFDKTVIVTDRVVLDRQLQSTVIGFPHTPGSIVTIGEGKTSADLRAALESKQARIIITTLQKFSVVADAATELAGTRFAVIVDEAHSSQSGEAAKDLKFVLGHVTGDEALAAAEKITADSEQAASLAVPPAPLAPRSSTRPSTPPSRASPSSMRRTRTSSATPWRASPARTRSSARSFSSPSSPRLSWSGSITTGSTC